MSRLTGQQLHSLSVVIDGARHDLAGRWVLRHVSVGGTDRLLAEPQKDSGADALIMVGIGLVVTMASSGVAAAAVGERVLNEIVKAYVTTGLVGIATLTGAEALSRLNDGKADARQPIVVAVDDSLMTGEGDR